VPRDSISKGYDPWYFIRVTSAGKENYYSSAIAAGLEPAGRWAGAGAESLGLAPGSVVDPDTLRRLFTERISPEGELLGRKPHSFDKAKLEQKVEERLAKLLADEVEVLGLVSPDQLTARRQRDLRFLARAECSRDHVNFYDYAFSVPKSVSLLQVGWTAAADKARAAGDLARAAECDAKAEEIEQAVLASAQSIVRMAEQHVYLRTGHHSATTGETQDAAGLTAAIFMHHTSRAAAGEPCGDPQLHAHVAFWAYAQLAGHGTPGMDEIYRCIAADGLYQMRSHYSGVAQLELEQRLQQLGYAIQRRPDGDFEVSGLAGQKVLRAFSSRSAEIARELEPKRRAFRDEHGHDPAAVLQRTMARDATMKTRQPKDYAPDRARQLAAWEAKYQKAALRALDEIPEQAADAARGARTWTGMDAAQRMHCTAVATATLQKQRSTWNWAHLSLEIRKTVDVMHPREVPPEAVEGLVLDLVREALTGGDVVLLRPPPAVEMPGKRRASGESVYTRPSEFSRYATVEHLLAEGRLLDDAGRVAEPVLDTPGAARAVGSTEARMEGERARQAADAGAEQEPADLSVSGLSNDQAVALYGLLTSGKTVNVLVGAAGTGKSHVVARLADIVRAETGGRVVGVTAAENAARVLTGEGLDDAHNIADFVGAVEGSEERRGHLPLHAGDWLVVDEAGTVDTATLLELDEIVKARGARMLLTGDPEQLSSVDAGGGMRLIADEHGYFEIREVKRFREAWEGPASLRIRAGDPSAVREYIERGRVIDGTEEHVIAQLVRQYTGSLVANRNALLITDANHSAADLAGAVRDQLVELGEVDAEGPSIVLSDENRASRGDLVRAMKNAKGTGPGGGKLANRDILVIDRLVDGQAQVRRLAGVVNGERQFSRPFTLPAAYLQTHSALAYGGNIWVGQGRTVDDSYELFSDATTRESFYVGITRGRDRNVAGVITERETDDPLVPGRIPQPRVVTAESVLTGAISRQRDDLTATEYLREQDAAEYSMASLVDRWQTITRPARFGAYDEVMRDAMPPEAYERLEADPERGTLVRYLRGAELDGADATAILREAIGQRDFTGTKSVAAVLHGRVSRLAGPVSHKALASYTAATPELGDPQAAAAARELARLADERTAELGREAAADRPVWALHALGEVPPDPVQREEWAAAAGKIAAWRDLSAYADPVDPVGAAPEAGAVERRAAWRAAADAAGLSPDDQGIRETPEMILLAQDREAARLREWAPADVTEERQAAELAKGSAVADARLAEAAARNAQLESEAQALRDLAASHQQLAGEVSVRTAWLAEQDEHRREWDAQNEAKLTGGAQARAELGRRREAGELVDELDVVKAWLDRGDSGKAEPAARADKQEAREQETAADLEAEPEAQPAPASEAQAGRDEHYRKVADHRAQAVEQPGRAAIEEAREAQARIDQQRAEAQTAERDVPPAQPEAAAEADIEAGS
jgi:conjugative relaxase-like TrwC/TraI family protein